MGAEPAGHVPLASLLDDHRTAVLALERVRGIEAVARDVRALPHVAWARGVELGEGKGYVFVRADVAMRRISATMDVHGLHLSWTTEQPDDAFAQHVSAPLAFAMPATPDAAMFARADADFKGRRYDDARRQYDLLAQDYQLHQWALLRMADLSSVTEGNAAACAGYTHVISASPLHLAARIAVLRASHLHCEGVDAPTWTEALRAVRRDDDSGRLLLHEAQWVFWTDLSPNVAASMFESTPRLFAAPERQRLLATAALGLEGDAQERFANVHSKEIAAHHEEEFIRLVMSEALCARHRTVNALLGQKPWMPPRPTRRWAALWRGHLMRCTPLEHNGSANVAANTDVVQFDRLLLGAGKRIAALEALLVPTASPAPAMRKKEK